MEGQNHEHLHPEEHQVSGWRSYGRGNGGRVWLGLLLSGLGGFWLVTNLTDNLSLVAGNPGRIVFPALTILLGIVAMFTKRRPRPTGTD